MKKLLAFFAAVMLASAPASALIINTLPYNLTNGSLADATQVMANYNQIVSDTNTNAAHNGANSDITSISGLTTPLAHGFGGTVVYTGGTTAGTANAQTLVTVTPSSFTLTAGNLVTFTAGNSNSAAATLAVNGTTAKALDMNTSAGVTALLANTVISGSSYVAVYDGTEYVLINPTPQSTGVTGPGSSTAGDLATFASTTGNTIQDSGIASTSLLRTVKVQTFASTGTYTPSTGMLYAIIDAWGGGGGGGGTTASSGACGGGGAAGGHARKVVTAATISTSQSVTIGASGTGGTTGGTGGTGGTTSVGSTIVSASGGTGGEDGTGVATRAVLGGTGGVGASGDINDTGAPGGIGVSDVSNGNFSGYGGSTALGGGGAPVNFQGNDPGNSGATNSGSGGSGACSAGTAQTGGTGAKGYVVITEFNSQ